MDRASRRFALEAIATADDATPGERLAALRALEAFEHDQEPALAFEVAEIAEDELDGELADLLAPVGGGRAAIESDAPLGRVLASALAGPERWPGLHAAIRAEIERRAEAIATARKDVGRVEREIERRAERKASSLLAAKLRELEAARAAEGTARALTAPRSRAEPAAAPEPSRELGRAPEPLALPPGLVAEDLQRGWPRRGRRFFDSR